MKYISAGCVSHSTFSGVTCGAGIGLIKSDIFKFDSNKHGYSGYIGIVGTKRKKPNYEHEAAYGVGVGYHYFFNGISKPGANIGLSVVTGEGDVNSGMFLQASYQF